jgi:hypothetical protein
MAPGPPPSSYNWLSLNQTASSKFNRAQVIIENVSWNSHEMNSQFIVTKHCDQNMISPKTCDQMKSTLFHILSSLTRQSQKKNTSFSSSLVYLQTCLFFLFFLSSILCCNHISNDHPQEDLAKFGYRSESKVNFQKKKNRIQIYIFAT